MQTDPYACKHALLSIRQFITICPAEAGVLCLPWWLFRAVQAAVSEKPGASRDLFFQFYRNPAEIIADADNQVRQQASVR